MIYYGKGGIQYDLSAQPLAAGGEGEIYTINGQLGLVAKIYKLTKINPEKERKLISMVGHKPNQNMLTQIAWPQDILYDSRRQFAGFVMPKMQINEDLNIIYEYGSSAKYPDMPWKNRIIIAENLCAVLHSIHNSGHVCGDLNPKNISVNPKTGFVVFLDTDSYHIQDGVNTYRCDVGIPEYLPVEIQRKMHGGSTLTTASLPTFSRDTDNFALAIHIFQLLMNGVHPFACAILPSHSSVTAPQPSDNIERGEFPFMQNMPGIKIPVYAPPITILPKTIQDLLKRAFIDGHGYPGARPKPVEWHTALDNLKQNLTDCNKVVHHQYHKSLSSCPWCAVDKAFSQSLQPKGGGLIQTPIKPPVSPPKPRVIAPAPNTIARPSPVNNPSANQMQSGKTFLRFVGIFLIIIISIVIVSTLNKKATEKVSTEIPIFSERIAYNDRRFYLYHTNEKLEPNELYLKFGQAWENNGVLLNLIKIDVRTNDHPEPAAVQAWFNFINYSGQRILVDINWDTIFIMDSIGFKYTDWEGGSTNFWVESGNFYSFSRYYSIDRGQKSRISTRVSHIKILANSFSRIENASWIYYLNPNLNQISQASLGPRLDLGQSISEGGISLTLTNIDVRSDQNDEPAAVHAWFSIKNNSPNRKLLTLNFYHIVAEDSFGRQYIDWDGSVMTLWLEPRQEYKFNRYYSEMSGTKSRMLIGSKYMLIKVDNFGGIKQNVLWYYEIQY